MTHRPVPVYEFYPPRREVQRSDREPAMIPPFKVKHPNRRRKQSQQQFKSSIADISTGLLFLIVAFLWFLVLAGF